MISDRDFNKIAAAGNFLTSDEKADLRRAVEGWAKGVYILLEDQQQNLTPKQQHGLVQKHLDLLNALIKNWNDNPQLWNILTAGELRHANKKFKGAELERVFDRIPRQTSKILEGFIQERDRTLECIAPESDPLLHVVPNAAKPALDFLACRILYFLLYRGKLGPKMPSESDWQVKFAREVFNVLLSDTLHFSASRQSDTWTLGAVRKRLAAHFDDVQTCINRSPNLKRERARRSNYRYRLRVEFMKVPNVSEQDARDFAHGMPVDLTIDPKEVVRQQVASWPT